jgi:hypothetical protein
MRLGGATGRGHRQTNTNQDGMWPADYCRPLLARSPTWRCRISRSFGSSFAFPFFGFVRRNNSVSCPRRRCRTATAKRIQVRMGCGRPIIAGRCWLGAPQGVAGFHVRSGLHLRSPLLDLFVVTIQLAAPGGAAGFHVRSDLHFLVPFFEFVRRDYSVSCPRPRSRTSCSF